MWALLLTTATIVATALALDDAGDRAALLDLFASTGGAQWTSALNWTLTNVSVCQWQFVTCSCDSFMCRVTALDVHANNLRGVLHDSIGALAQLTYLDVGRNAGLGGTVPATIGNLTRLVNLRLGDSALIGTVPSTLVNLRALQQLDLCGNQFSGALPDLSASVALTVVGASANVLTVFPEWIARLPRLEHVFLATNVFSSPLPSSLGALTQLRTLDVCGNARMGGTFPEFLRSMPALECLSLCSTNLTGVLPSWLSNMTAMYRLLLSNNQLSGTLPDLGALQRLAVLDVSSNFFVGVISESVSTLTALQSASFALNAFSGQLPSFAACSALVSLSVAGNRLTGTVPATLGALAALEDVRLDANSMHDELPLELLNSSSLRLLDASSNALTGAPLQNLGTGLVNVQKLSLHSNAFTGSIVLPPGTLANLRFLFIQNNRFSGSLPEELSSLTKLAILYAHNNSLASTLPVCLRSLATSLLELKLSDNAIHGELPPWLGALSNLEVLDLHSNSLSGELLSSLGNLTRLKVLDVSNNRFSSTLPASLGDLSALRELRIDANRGIVGTLPASFAQLSRLRILKLNDNALTGPFPTGLVQQLTRLDELDLSCNQFSGAFDFVGGAKVVNVSGNSFASVLPSEVLVGPQVLDISDNAFACPYPLAPSGATVTLFERSACQPQWTKVVEAFVAVSSLAVCAFAAFFCTLKHAPWSLRSARFRTFMFVVAWTASAVSLAIDVAAYGDMIVRLRARSDQCTPVNQHAVFAAYMPFTLSQQEDTAPPSQLFADWLDAFGALRLNTSFTYPVAAGQGQTFFVTDVSQEALSTPAMCAANERAFAALCRSVAGCGVDGASDACTTVDASATEYGSPFVRVFWACVVVAASVRVALELARACTVCAAFADGGAQWQDASLSSSSSLSSWRTDFCGESLVTPALFALSAPATRDRMFELIVMHDTSAADLLRRIVHRGLLQTLPILACNLVYFFHIVQTGLSVAQWLSLAFGLVLLPQLCARAFRAWRKQDPSYTDKELDAILEQRAAYGAVANS